MLRERLRRAEQLHAAALAELRRQDSTQCYDMNASIYVWKRKCLLDSDSIWNEQTRLYVMSEVSMDIDSELDFEIVEFLMSREKKI